MTEKQDINTMDQPVAIITKDLGERIAAYRLSLNLRQQDVASSIGVARSTVARLEAGEGGTIDTLVRILKALGAEDRIEMLVPDARTRPLDPRRDADQRQRASGPDANSSKAQQEGWSWGEDQ
jgi:transcriptional regulator with XRE-family HTH domain